MSVQVETTKPVREVLESYPKQAAIRLEELRNLILEAAAESEWVDRLEETLKWGEPSYLAKYGSTIRIDWKEKNPDQFSIYFKCTSRLVPTFRELFPDKFEFEGNRAIVFGLNDAIPSLELKQCVKAALEYHKIKHLPLLGF